MIGPPGTQPTAGMEGWTQVGYVTGPTALTLDSPPDDTEHRTLTEFHGTITFPSVRLTPWGRAWLRRWRQERSHSAMHTAYRAKTRRRNRKRK